jgi:tight adherence protein B
LKIILAASAIGALLGVMTGSWVLAIALAVGGVFAPKVALSIWKDIRSRQFEAQLLDALILLGNAMKSGLDVAAGIELIATNLKAPISEEFGLVINAFRLGTPIERALLDMTERINSRTLETVVYSINIQRESGGNIIKTFDQLIETIREENKLQKKIKAMTSQGRAQIVFLAGFPWALGALFLVMAPDFMLPALRHPWGQFVLIGLVVWEIIGIRLTKKIVTVEI